MATLFFPAAQPAAPVKPVNGTTAPCSWMKFALENRNTGEDAPAHFAGHDSEATARHSSSDSYDQEPYTVRSSHSAGGVAYRQGTSAGRSIVEIALIASDSEGRRWQLPKGRLYPTEESLTAALREVEEETGLQTEFRSFLKTVYYQYLDTYARIVPERVFKKVDFYLLRVVGGQLSDASVEVQKVEWASSEDALSRLVFEGERDCIRLAMEHLNGN